MSKKPALGLWFAATSMIFFTRAALYSTWQSRSPEVQEALHLDTAQMGWFVMLYPVGGILGVFFANALTTRFGSNRLTIVGFSISAAALAGLAFAVPSGNVILSSALLVLMGFPMAIADFTGNFEGSEVDKRSKRSLFPAIHSTFGIGMIVAATFAGWALTNNVDLTTNYLGIAVVVAVGSIWAGTVFPENDTVSLSQVEKAQQKKLDKLVWTEKRTLLIAIIGFSFIMTEIGAGTWVPIALKTSGFSGAEAATAFGLMWFVITAGRAVGGFLVDRIGRFATVLFSAIVTAAGITVFLLDAVIHQPYLGLILWGIGQALGFPMAVSSMSDDPKKSPARINMIITVVYISSIAVGPVLGSIGQSFGIYIAFAVPAALMVLSAVLSPATKPEKL
jgi:fucose permease